MIDPVESAAPEEAPAPLAASLPEGVGARLRRAREATGMSLSDVAQRLKYSSRQVQALEEGRSDALPGLTFQRGFVRSYAKLLGLDGDELVAGLVSTAQKDNGPSTEQLKAVAYTRVSAPSGANRATPWVVAMLAAVIGIGGYALHRWEAPPQVKVASQPVAPLPMTQPAMPEPPVAEDRPIPMPQPVAEAEPTPAVRSGKIRLVFSGESWTEVRQAGGAIAFSGTGNPGTEQWIDGQAPFDLVIGNARAVQLYYRGDAVDLGPYIKVSVARLQLK